VEGADRLGSPKAAVEDREGGHWILYGHGGFARVLAGQLLRLSGRGTPLLGKSIYSLGITPGGTFWCETGRYGEGRHLFLRRAPLAFTPEVKAVDGRCLALAWKGGDDLFAVEVRIGDEPPRILSESATIPLAKAGRRTVEVKLRPIDSLGFAGPVVQASVAVDVRLPCIRWTGEGPPTTVADPWWTIPVEVEWTDKKIERKIEYRVDGGEWREILRPFRPWVSSMERMPHESPATRICTVPHNGHTVRLEIRAVEEGAFPSEVLSATITVEYSLDEWIEARIQTILNGDTREREEAIHELSAAPKKAAARLEAHRKQRHREMNKLQRAVEKLIQK
jgi:hypothetical protein